MDFSTERLFHSPLRRGARSVSIAVAGVYSVAFQELYSDTEVDTLDLWHENLPSFDGPVLEAKYAGLTGRRLTEEQQSAWSRIEEITEFLRPDVILSGVPMWNFGIPYKLKHLIDLVSQKDVLFRFDQNAFDGLLKNKKAVPVCAPDLNYATDTETPESEFDFQKSYIKMGLRFVETTNVETLMFKQTLMGPEANQLAQKGTQQARALATASAASCEA